MNRATLRQQWDRALAIVAAIAGTALLVIGWVHVSGTNVVASQIPYLASESVSGLIAFGIATTLWISADLRDEWAKLDDIHRAVDSGDGAFADSAEPVRATDYDGVPDGASKHRREARVLSHAPMEESLT
jgi:hypothetical protein